MAQQFLYNHEQGLLFRTALNQMFTELYSAAGTLPIQLPNTSSNIAVDNIPADTFINDIAILVNSGSPTIRIGITPGGNEILDDFQFTTFNYIQTQYLITSLSNIYITFVSGSGNVNIRIDPIYNFI